MILSGDAYIVSSRNLLERTMTIYGSNQVPVSVLTAALRVSEDDEDGHVCDTYAEGIVARLLLYGYCKVEDACELPSRQSIV